MNDNFVTAGQLSSVITKLIMAEATLQDTTTNETIEIEAKYFLKDLIYLKNNLIILKEKLHCEVYHKRI